MRAFPLLALLLLPGLAAAQADANRGNPETAAAEDAVLSRFRQSIAGGSCPGAALALAAPTGLYRPATDSIRQLAAVRIRADGCGSTAMFNFLVATARDGKVNIAPTLHGTTNTDHILQRDVAPQAIAAVRTRFAAPGCTQVDLLRGDFAGPPLQPGETLRTRAWNEVWLVRACDKAFQVPISFTPAGQGTRYEVRGAAISPAG